MASSIDSKSSAWESHVRMTAMRNERIRLQSEATKLRSAFVAHDQRLTGAVPSYILASCLKAGGSQLPKEEMNAIYRKFMTSSGQFAWLRFCESLEKKGSDIQFHPKRTMARPQTAVSESHRGGSVSNKFLDAKASRRSLGQSASIGSLGSLRSLGPSPSMESLNAGKVNRMRRMVSEASLKAEEMKQKKIEAMTEWIEKNENKQKSRPRSAASVPRLAPPTPESVYSQQYEPEPQYAAPKRDIHADYAEEQELKKVLAMAEEGLNSRFSDMFKAFQYVDLDRSGTLNEKEIRRALDMWNIPISDEKLRELILACDFDGDGAVDYKEFVDVLARDTVAPAAMGKRDMQSLEAMGVDSQEMLAHQLGHKSKKQHESISINS